MDQHAARRARRASVARAGRSLFTRAKLARAVASVHAHGIEALESRVLLSDTLTVNNTVVNSIAYPFMGVNYVEFWDSLQGSAAVQNALKNAGVQVIRFPGGAPGDWYQWDNSASWDVSNGGNNTSPLRLASFASAVGAKVLMQTNSRDHVQGGKANDPSGTHTAQYVSYMDANNAYVPYWEIGNEQDMDSINSSTWPHYDWGDYQWYMDRFNDQAAAMKAVDPTIKVMGPAGTNTWYWNAMDSLDMFLSKAGNRAGSGLVDAVSLHWYGGGDSAASWGSVESFAQGWNTSSNWQFIKSTIAQTDTRNLPVFVTEGNAADGAQGTGATMSYTLGSALANGDMVGALRDSGVQSFEWFGDLHGVYSPTYGGWGIFYGGGDHGTQETPSPKYFMLPIWSRAGNEQMSLTSSVSDASTTLSAYAARATNGNIQVFIVNKTNAARTEDINLSNFAGLTGKAVKVYELRGATGSITDDTVIYNGVTNPTVTTTTPLPAPLDGGTVSGTTYSRTVPAYSLTMLEFQVNNANLTPVARISSPADTGTVENNGPIVVSADAFASGTGNTLSKVEFYANSTLIGTATTGSNNSWAISWSGATAGSYSITAKAYSTNGTTSTSAPVSVTVVARGGTAVAVPGIIQAETYNTGGQYIAFRDLDGSSPQTGSASGVTYLTTIHNAEYDKYSITVGTAGTYAITARVANSGAGGKFHFNIDGVNVTGSMTVPNTGGATTWYTIGKNGISLSAGAHTMQFVVDSSYPATGGTMGNVDYFQVQSGTFTEATPTAPTISGSAGSQLASLSWNGVVGATTYNIYRGLSSSNLTLDQSGVANTSFNDTGLTNGTTYYYQVTAVTQSGVESAKSNMLNLAPVAPATISLPWQAADIGSPTLAGSSTTSGGAFTVSGAGGDIQGTADQCQFLYRQVSGDVTITAQIISQGNTNEWAKAGPMIRQSLDAGAVNAYTRMTPTHNAGFQFRTTAAGSSTDNVLTNSVATPCWLRLVRSGSTFTAYTSPDNVTWTQFGSSQTLTMTGNVYVGIAVTSHNTAQLSAATFANVSVTSTSIPAVPTLTATPASSTQINLSWTNVASENGYEIDRSSDGTVWTALTTTAADVTTYNDNGLTANTMYYYRVRSYAGTSPSQIRSDNSAAVSATTSGTVSATPGTPTLVAASDTGVPSDAITNLDNTSGKTLQFTVAAAVNGATVTLYADGTAIGTGTVVGTSVTITTNGSFDLIDGQHSITARQTESGKSQSPDSTALTIWVDTTSPTGSVPDLNSASDTGSSTTDNITQGTSPQFDGTASDPTSNSYSSGLWKVTVSSDDGKSTTDSTSPFYSAVLATLNEGTRSVTATVYDVAGNTYTTSALSVMVDRTAPTASVPDLNAAADTGILNTDNITQGSAPQFDGTASDPTSGGYSSGINRVTVASDDGKSTTDSTSPFYSATLAALNEGTRTVAATVYDTAGNSFTTGALTLTVDRTGPTAAITAVSPDPHAGAVASIAVGFTENVYGPTWSLFNLARDGGANMLTSSQAVTGSGTSWSITNLDAAGITDRLGSYTLSAPATASITDAAGNALVGTASDTWLNTAMNLSGTNNKIVRNGANLDVYVNSATVTYSTPYAWYGQLAISGGSGDDSLTVSFANGANPVPAGGISFDGGTGANTLYLVGSSSLDPFTLTGAVATHSGSTVTFTNTQKLDLSGGAFTLNTNVLGKSLAISNGSLIFSTSQDVGGLNVAAGAMAKLAQSNGTQLVLTVPNAALFIAGTDAAPTGQIDLTNNMMVVTGLSDGSDHAAVAGRVRSLLQAGRNGGVWTGNGIVSSTIASHAGTALGYLDNGTQTTVRYTWAGDTNLDQTVNFDDLLVLGQRYNQTGQTWQAGDSTYDGIVNFDDLLVLAQRYNSTPTGLAIAELQLADAPVPSAADASTNNTTAPATGAAPAADTPSTGDQGDQGPADTGNAASQPEATQPSASASVGSDTTPAAGAATSAPAVTDASAGTTPPSTPAVISPPPDTATTPPTPATVVPVASSAPPAVQSTSSAPAPARTIPTPTKAPGAKVVKRHEPAIAPPAPPAPPARKNPVAVHPIITGRPAPAAPALSVVHKNKRDPKVFEDRSAD